MSLRAWFGSRRYSEDLDIDVVRGQTHVLEEKVDKLPAVRRPPAQRVERILAVGESSAAPRARVTKKR